MNVLQVVPELNAGGVERTTLEIVEALSRKGYGAHVVSAGGRLEDELAALGGKLHRYDIGSKNPLKLRRSSRYLIDLIKANDIDIVHARSRAPAWPAMAAAKATGCPFITTYHGIYNAGSPMKRRYNAIMSRGDFVIANSEFTKNHILAQHGTDPDRITVIPRGVDMRLFDPESVSADEVQAFRELWDVSAKQTAVLLPGRLTRWKGQLTAIQALKDLPPSVFMILMGDAQGRTDYLAELSKTAADLGVTDRLRITDHSPDMPAALMAADVVISASTDPEAFGRVMAEAQAMKRPVVSTAHGGALETIEENVTGLLVPPGNAESLAAAILKTQDWADYNGDYARQRIEDKFSKSALQRATLAVYDKALKAKTTNS